MESLIRKLRQLMLLEEFKNCLPAEMKIHLDDKKRKIYTRLQFGQMIMHLSIKVHLRKYSCCLLRIPTNPWEIKTGIQ